MPPTNVSAEKVAGDAAAGKTIFEGKGGCLNCHRVYGSGKGVGPDLSMAGRAPAAQLLAKITDPSMRQAQGGRGGGRGRGGPPPPATVVIKAADGKEYRGARRNEDSLYISLVDMDGNYRTFTKSAVSVRVTTDSLMPGDYSTRLTAAELQNIVAYLKTLDGKDPSRLGGGPEILSWDRLRNAEKEPQNYIRSMRR